MKFGDKPESFDIDDNISCYFGFWVLFSDFPDVSVSECFIFCLLLIFLFLFLFKDIVAYEGGSIRTHQSL